MSGAISLNVLSLLIEEITYNHSYTRPHLSRAVKYFAPSIDTRTGECYAIRFWGTGEEVVFHTQNECRDLSENLYMRVMRWLSEKE